MENKKILNEENLKSVNGGATLGTVGTLDRQVEALFESAKKVLETMKHNSIYPVGDEPENKLYNIKKAAMLGDMDKAKTACDSFREYMVSIEWGGFLNTSPFKDILEMFG